MIRILNFSYADNLFGKLIQWRNKFFYGSPYTHTAIIVGEDEANYTIAEALDRGFTISPYEKWWVQGKVKEGVIEVGKAKVSIDDDKLIALAKKYEGIRYGWDAIFHIIISFFTKKNTFTDGEKSLICSEAVARLLYDASNKKIDFEKEFNKPFDEVTPDDLSGSKYIAWGDEL